MNLARLQALPVKPDANPLVNSCSTTFALHARERSRFIDSIDAAGFKRTGGRYLTYWHRGEIPADNATEMLTYDSRTAGWEYTRTELTEAGRAAK